MDLSDDFKTDMRARLNRIEDKVDGLFAFKWQVIGMGGLAGAIFSVAVAIVAEWIRK